VPRQCRTVSLLTTELLSGLVWTAVVSAIWSACRSRAGSRRQCGRPSAASSVPSVAAPACVRSTNATTHTHHTWSTRSKCNSLSGRLQCTKVGDIFSPYRHLSSGVIQGSCLGPLLYVIYVNDVVSLFGEDCVCKLYADDMKLYMRMNSSYCAPILQNYLDRLAHWSRIWQLNTAYQKCAVMQIGNIVPDCSYAIASNRLSNVDIVKDLGVFVDESLTFSNHICHIVTRAFNRANLIHKCFYSKHVPTLVRAFVVYVRPLLRVCIACVEPTSDKAHQTNWISSETVHQTAPWHDQSYL